MSEVAAPRDRPPEGNTAANTAEQGVHARGGRANLRPPWKPGESGNPRGRPKGRKSLKELTYSELDKIDPKTGRTGWEVAAEQAARRIREGIDDGLTKELYKRLWPLLEEQLGEMVQGLVAGAVASRMTPAQRERYDELMDEIEQGVPQPVLSGESDADKRHARSADPGNTRTLDPFRPELPMVAGPDKGDYVK